MAGPSYLVRQYGARGNVAPPAGGFFSEGEETVWHALVERIGRENFLYHVPFGDLPFTPGREEREVDFVVPVLSVLLFINSAFTHPDPNADALTAGLFRALGYHSEFLWDYEILPRMNGDVHERLDRVPGLAFFGQRALKRSVGERHRVYAQPARDTTFRKMRAF